MSRMLPSVGGTRSLATQRTSLEGHSSVGSGGQQVLEGREGGRHHLPNITFHSF